jgi:hypothetical protein
MNNDLAAVGSAHQAELSANSETAHNSTDASLKFQLNEALSTSRQPGAIPPKLDVITAIDKLQTLSQLFDDSKSSHIIEKLIAHLHTADPIALAKPNVGEQMIQRLFAAAAAPPPQVGKPISVQKTSGSESAKMGKKPRTHGPHRSETGLSGAVKALIKFLFG